MTIQIMNEGVGHWLVVTPAHHQPAAYTVSNLCGAQNSWPDNPRSNFMCHQVLPGNVTVVPGEEHVPECSVCAELYEMGLLSQLDI